MRRFKGAFALLLTALFAVAGAFDHHDLPRTSHDHGGFCSADTSTGLESCAICKAVRTVVHLAGVTVACHTIDDASHLVAAGAGALSSAVSSLLADSRASPLS